MIKTHKPRGHLWTCPSLFQQSPEIRNISFEDCTPPPSKVIVEDSDDELQPKQRAAKRRRIERLADEFLNGQPLVITCVRPHPSALRGAIEAIERSRRAAKYVLPEPELSDDDGEMWTDVGDGYVVPGKVASIKSKGVLKQQADRRKGAVTATETVTEEHASSACKPVRRVAQAVKVHPSLDPSAEAIKQAAALRERRLQRAITDVPKLPEVTSADTISPSDNAGPYSEQDAMPARSIRNRKHRSTEWLLRRHTILYELSADESLDELNRSGMETPSRPSQMPASHQAASSPVPLAEATNDSPKGSTSMALTDVHDETVLPEGPSARVSLGRYEEHWECFDGAAASRTNEAPEDDASSVKGSYHTAPEATDPVTRSTHEDEKDHSQTRLLRSQDVNAAPRRVWTSTNGSTAHESPALQPNQPSKPKRTQSAGGQADAITDAAARRQSAPTASQDAPTPIDQDLKAGALTTYTEAKTKETGETPFMFRKRTSKGSREGTVAAASTKQRRPMTFLSCEDTPAKEQGTPRLDVSIGNDSFGNKLNLALTDEHLGAVLPKEPGTASAIRRAIREEWRQVVGDGGEEVEISRVEDEPASSQVEALAEATKMSFTAINHVRADGDEGKREEPQQTQWPGTQAMLSKAHAEFFESPQKAPMAQSPKATDTPPATADSAANNTTIREPLKTLSQEPVPLPSTQAMVEAWSPWSTVKKPKGNSARVAMGRKPASQSLSTSTGSDGSRRRSSLRTSVLAEDSPVMADANARRSSLRFSTSVTDSPTAQRLPFSVTKPISQSQEKGKEVDDNCTTTPTSVLRTSHGSQRLYADAGETTVAWEPTTVVPGSAPAVLDGSIPPETGTKEAESSLQYAQRPLFRDDSNLSQTIDDLNASVLSLGELDGVLSQLRN